MITRGREALARFAQSEGYELTDEIVHNLTTHLGLDTPDDLYERVGKDEIDLSADRLKALYKKRTSLLRKLLRNPFASKKKRDETTAARHQPIDRKQVYVLHPDAKTPNYLIEPCCSPILAQSRLQAVLPLQQSGSQCAGFRQR